MKQLAVILLAFVAFASANVIKDLEDIEEHNTAYGYLNKIGIPLAERIEKAEKELLRNPNSRIHNGSPAEIGEFKHQAGLIGEFEGRTNRSVCGAVLVTSTSLITAAHCWTDGVNQVYVLTVVLGSNLLFSGGTRIQTNNVVVHPLWFPLLFRNDIAIIKLPVPVAISELIAPIRLPNILERLESFAGERATISGFGITGDGANITNYQYLSKGSVVVQENSRCLNFFPDLVFQDSNICVSTLGEASTCGGDSGGPLTVQRSNGDVLIGITSYGLRWCSIGYPAAFVRVTSYLDWIQRNL